MSVAKSIEAMFCADGIALFGSVKEGKLGHLLLKRLIDGGYDSNKLYAVNPKGEGDCGVKGYTNITEIKRYIDLAVIASPAAVVPTILDDCGKAGVKAAVIISSGFSEAGQATLEGDIRRIAKKHDIRFIGPNCAGMANTNASLYATIEATPIKGNVAVISQSGAVGGIIMDMSKRYNMGIGKFASYGNGVDLRETELLEYLSDDSDTDAVAMYIESVKDGRKFMDALKKTTLKKPVVVIKSGKSQCGQRAAQSHTGSMAGSDKVYQAAIESCGAIRVDTMDEMFDACKVFSAHRTINGKRIAIITNSGGPGVMTADKCEECGLNVEVPSQTLRVGLRNAFPAHYGLANPFDMTVEGTPAQYADCLKRVIESKEYDAAVVIYVGTPYLDAEPYANALAECKKSFGADCIPVTAWFEIGNDVEAAKTTLDNAGILTFPSGERIACALGRAAKYSEFIKNGVRIADLYPDVEQKTFSANTNTSNALLEPQAMRFLAMEGKIEVPRFFHSKNMTEAVKACETIGYPVCMKVVATDILHKSEFGGVKLNVSDPIEATHAFRDLQNMAEDKGFAGVIVYPMINGGHEIIMGIAKDEQFGPVVVFGMGGVYTELSRDIALRVAPVNTETAMEMIHSVKGFDILNGARGSDSVDFSALCDMLVKLSNLPIKYPQIKEIDLNPVFAKADGAVIADARIILEK